MGIDGEIIIYRRPCVEY